MTGTKRTRRLVESAMMIALGTVLSLIQFIKMPLGGSVTAAAMVPIVIIAYRYGAKWGGFTAVVYGLIQMMLGLDNVQYASSVIMAIAIILLDYLVAFGVIGLAPALAPSKMSRVASVAVGTTAACFLRFLCHFASGWMIWEALWPNELGMASPVYSLAYNGTYMLPETIITVIAAMILVPVADKIKKD